MTQLSSSFVLFSGMSVGMNGFVGRHRGGRYGMSYGGSHHMMVAGDDEGGYEMNGDRAEESKFRSF